jgi:hypothetical protein
MATLTAPGTGIGISHFASTTESPSVVQVQTVPESGDAFSVSPLEFHQSHFNKAVRAGDERAKDAWMWYFPGVHSTRNPELDEAPSDLLKIPLLHCRPSEKTSPRVGCRVCWDNGKKWQTYKNCPGVVTNLRSHMLSEHPDLYKGYLDAKERDDERKQSNISSDVPSFTQDGFHQRLMRWVVADDQVSA